MNRIVSFVAASLLVLLPMSSFAQMGRQSPEDLFEQADTNRDGLVSRDEFMASRAARFDRLDRNHDGYLSDADVPRFLQSNPARMEKLHRMVQMFDTNHDGMLSRQEFIDAGAQIFAMADINHDGFVDQNEMQQAAQRMRDMAGQ